MSRNTNHLSEVLGIVMSTWVDDIVQALKDLGGLGSLNQIYDQVALIRKEPMPVTWKASIRERIEAHSKDSKNFKGKHYFSRISKGVWSLSDVASPVVINQDVQKESDISSMGTHSNQISDDPFVVKELLNFSIAESLESISNLFLTIKQYRDYADKENVTDWFQYIHDIFNLLGLSTKKISPRLFTLQDMGADPKPKALVCVVGPLENFEDLAFEVTWESYLFYAAKFHNLDWIILTNGLQIKVMNCHTDQEKRKIYEVEFDEMLVTGNINSFFTFYKIMNLINHSPKEITPPEPGLAPSAEKGHKRVLVARHKVRKEFWTQFIDRSRAKTNLFSRKSPGVDNYLGVGSGKMGIVYYCNANYENSRIDIYIDKGDYSWNKAAFDYLYRYKSEIEREFRASLDWLRLDEKRASIIRFPITGLTLQNREAWSELQDSLIDNTIKLEAIFHPLIQGIPHL